MPAVGTGAYEIRVHVLGDWRVIYVAKFVATVYVLHAFHKKMQTTRKEDFELAGGLVLFKVGSAEMANITGPQRT